MSMTPRFPNLRPLLLAAALVAMVVLFVGDGLPPAQAQTPTGLSALRAESSTDGSTFAAMTGAEALAPAFAAATTGYRATVGNDVTHIRLTPTVAVSGSTVQVGKSGNLETVASGTASNGIALYVGDNEVIVRVTASDNTTQDYTVTVRRVPSGSVWWATLTVDEDLNGFFGCDNADGDHKNCSLSSVLTDDDFLYEGTTYQVIWFYWSPDDDDLTIGIDGLSGWAVKTALGSLTLNVGGTAFAVSDATATSTDINWPYYPATDWADGDTVSLWLWTQSSDANLSNLTASSSASAGGTFTPLTLTPSTFDPTTTGYTATVANNITHARLTPTVNDSNATVQVGKGATLETVASGTASNAIALDLGANAITVRVTAQDSSTQDYTVTITRQRSSDATLRGLTASSGTSATATFSPLALSPTFAPGTTSYTARVPASRTHVKLTPTTNHGGASVEAGKGTNLAPVTSSAASNAIELDTGENAITVRVTAQDSATTQNYTVTITRRGQIAITDWTPTLNVGRLGPGGNHWVGCRNGVEGAECNSQDVFPENEFTYTRNIYGEPVTWTFSVQELYRTSNTSQNDLVLLVDVSFMGQNGPVPSQSLRDSLFQGLVLTVLDPRNGNTTPERFPLDQAVWERNKARWKYDGTPWFAGSTALQLGMERPRATLDTIYVHYDGAPAVDNFTHWEKALLDSYGYRVNIPGEFPSIDPDLGVVQTTLAKVKVFPAFQGSTLRVGKVSYPRSDQSDPQASPPVVCEQRTGHGSMPVSYWRCVALAAVTAGVQSHAIELNAHSPNTHVDIEVMDGEVTATYLLNIDPPPRTYSLNPQAWVMEGQDALLTLTLSEPAPAGGLEFTVTASHESAGSEDVGAVDSPVTVPGGATSLQIAVPTADDDRYEGEESFTVSVAATGSGWAVDPQGTATATVTIEDNDEAPTEPTPPEGTEPWDIQVVPGDGTLTVSWTVAPKEGVEDGDIRHALRWSQEPGVWANPRDPKNIGKNDGITVAGGVTGYVITGLRNDVATGVFVRSYTGSDHSESSPQSSRWVRLKGEDTTPRGEEQRQSARTYAVTAAARAVEGGEATLTVTLSEAAPEGGVEFSVTLGYSGGATVTADDVGAAASPVTVAQGNTTLDIAIPTAADAVDEDDETFTVVVAASTAGWEKAGDGRDTATVTIADDDTAGITVAAANPLSLTEDGSATYTVVLDSRPAANVTVTASSGDNGAATVSPASHTFTPSGWSTPLTFTVSGVADDDPNHEQVAVSHGATSDDGKYAALLANPVPVSVSDTTADAAQGDQSPQAKYAELIAKVYEWRNDPCCVDDKAHTDRWDRVLLTFGETVADTTLTIMTSAEAHTYVNRGWTRWIEVAKALREMENRTPTLSSALADVTIVNESGTRQVSLVGVFSDADNDALTITEVSSDQAVATILAATDQSSLTVSAHARGTATGTITADDGWGGTVSDTFTITVKAAPVVSSALPDVSGLEEGSKQEVSLAGVFRDADGDSFTITAASSDDAIATVTVASGGSKLTLTGVAGGTATITVTAQDTDSNRVSDTFEVSVVKAPEPANRAPTVSSAIADATIVNESETHQDSLSGVFSDADDHSLTIDAASSDDAVATVSVSSDGSSLTVTAQSRGTATITVTADDGNGGTVSDTLDVTVKAAPVVSSALADISGVEVESTQDVSLAGAFSDADGDALTITAASSDETKATVSVAPDGSKLTLTGVAEGTTTITVTVQDTDGNQVSETFDALVAKKHAGLIAQMYEWRNDSRYAHDKAHTDRWDRALLAFGETVADTTLTPMPASEAQTYADRGWTRWAPVAAALREIEAGGSG